MRFSTFLIVVTAGSLADQVIGTPVRPSESLPEQVSNQAFPPPTNPFRPVIIQEPPVKAHAAQPFPNVRLWEQGKILQSAHTRAFQSPSVGKEVPFHDMEVESPSTSFKVPVHQFDKVQNEERLTEEGKKKREKQMDSLKKSLERYKSNSSRALRK